MSATSSTRKRSRVQEPTQGLANHSDWRRPTVRWGLGTAQVVLLVLLVIVGLGPILWLAKSAITPTQDTLIQPMALFPHGFAWSNLTDAWTQVDIGLYLWNTIVIAFGSLAGADHRRRRRAGLRCRCYVPSIRRRSRSCC